MRITRVEIRNFRSIEKIVLETDRPFVVLEGPNDSGKSNIVQAIDLALRLAANSFAAFTRSSARLPVSSPQDYNSMNVLRRGASAASVALNIVFDNVELERIGVVQGWMLPVKIEWIQNPDGSTQFSGESVSDSILRAYRTATNMADAGTPPEGGRLNELARILGLGVRHIGTKRFVGPENFATETSPQEIEWNGYNLKTILLRWKVSEIESIQGRFEELRRRLADPELPVGELFVGLRGNTVFASTRLGEETFDIGDRSSGVQQLIFLFSLALCHRGTIAIIEEPELNLSQPLQAVFWKKLRELAMEGQPLRQIFLTSHSPFFEREAERVLVERPLGGTTKARWVDPPPPADEELDVRPLPVTRDGTLQLDATTRERLQVTTGGHVYLREMGKKLDLLSSEQFAKLLRSEPGEAE